jgi:hypothetical protein
VLFVKIILLSIESLSAVKKKGSKKKRSDSEAASEGSDVHDIGAIQRKVSLALSKKIADERNSERVVMTPKQKLIEKMRRFEIGQREVQLNLDSFNFNVI